MADKIGTSTLHWFGRGMAGGLMLIAAANAASYFFRSDDLGPLFGHKEPNNFAEAIGFPFEIWRSGENYNGWLLNYSLLPWNVLSGVVLGCIFGWIGIACKPMFNQWIAEFEEQESRGQVRLQFSVKGLLVLTTIASMIFAATTAWGKSPHLLGAIYFIGPLCLILIAMAPNHIPWQYRAGVLVLVAITMIAIGIATGSKLGMRSDQVLLGIFVSWTPQSAFLAFLILAGMMIERYFKR